MLALVVAAWQGPSRRGLSDTFFSAVGHPWRVLRQLAIDAVPALPQVGEASRGQAPAWSVGLAACVSGALGVGAVMHRQRVHKRGRSCCPPGALGPAAAESAGTGRMELLPGGLEAYVVGSGGRAIVVASDIFGIHSGRLKQICDELAAEGYLVVMPDFFKGAFPDEGSSLPWWKLLLQAPGLVTPLNMPWASVEEALRRGVLPYLAQAGCSEGKAGILGFCWGAWVVVRACGAFPGAFACGASAHPSVSGMATRWGEDEALLLRAVRAPQLVLASRDEPQSWKPGGATEDTLRAATGSSSHVFKEFSTVSHGFVPRGNLNDPVVAVEVARAMEYIKGFLGKHLAWQGSVDS